MTVTFTLADAVTLTGAPTYVPDGSAIHDGDPATYIEFIPAGIGVTGQSAAVGFDLASVNYSSISFTAVVSRTTSSAARFTWDIVDANGTTGGLSSAVDVGSNDFITEAPGVLQTISRTFDDAYFAPGGMGEADDFVNPPGMTLQEWLTGLIAIAPGPHVVIASSLRAVRVHEITLTGVPANGLAPPCQLYPRDDDQGVGSAAVWPPPSSGRPGSYY